MALFGLLNTVNVWEYERGLLYKKGRFIQLLEPGQYRLWYWQYRHIETISLRQVSQTLSGQEVLTTDKVPVRVTVIAQYAVTNAIQALHVVENYVERLYQDVQLALRDIISSRSVDEILSDRAALSSELHAATAPLTEQYGITLHRVGVKDIILPGAVQRVFLKEIEADRAGRAALVAARHETAAARAQANTAKIMRDNPVIMRLQELETLVKMAANPGNLLVVPGLNTLLAQVQRPTNE